MVTESIVVELDARISGFTSNMRKAEQQSTKSTSKINRGFNKVEDSQKRATESTKKFTLSTVASSVGIALATSKLISYADSATLINNKLKIATGSTEELSKVTSELFETSNETGTAISATADLYAKLERSTRSMGVSQERLLSITETVNKSFAIGTATTQEAAGSIRQLGQAMASGVLRGDEYNSISEQAPVIMEAIQKATGKTSGELRKMAAEGLITSEILIESLERYKSKIDTDFATATKTFGQKLTIAENQAIEFVGSSDEITGAVGVAGDAVLFLSSNIDKLVTVTKVAAGVYGAILLTALTKATKAKLATIASNVALANSEAKAAVAAKVAAAEAATAATVRATASRAVAAALVTETRETLVSSTAAKEKSVTSIVAARATERSALATVEKTAAELAELKATAVTITQKQQVIVLEKRLTAEKAAAVAATKALAAAEMSASAAAGSLTVAKKAATAATTQLTAAKTLETSATARATVATGVATKSAAGLSAASLIAARSVGALKWALAALGGPVGILATAAVSLALFVDWERDSSKQLKKTTADVEDQIKSLKGLTAAQLEATQQEFIAKQVEVSEKIQAQTAVIKELTEQQIQASASTREFGSGFAALGGQIETAKDELSDLFKQQEAIQKLGGKIFDLKLETTVEKRTEEKGNIDLEKGKADEKAKAKLEKDKEDFKELQLSNLDALLERFKTEEEILLANHELEKSLIESTIEGEQLKANAIKSLNEELFNNINNIKQEKAEESAATDLEFLQSKLSAEQMLINEFVEAGHMSEAEANERRLELDAAYRERIKELSATDLELIEAGLFEELDLKKAQLDTMLIDEEAYHEAVIAIEAAAESQREALRKKNSAKKIKSDKDAVTAERQKTDSMLSIAYAANSMLMEDNKDIGSAIIVADTSVAVMRQFKDYPDYIAYGTSAAIIANSATQLANLSGASRGAGSVSGASGGGRQAGSFSNNPNAGQDNDSSFLEVSEQTESGSQTIRVEFATDSGDELLDSIANGLNERNRFGR